MVIMAHACRTFRITTSEGKTIALGAISAKQAEHFLAVIRPDWKVALIEEIPELPEQKPWFYFLVKLFFPVIAILKLVTFALENLFSFGAILEDRMALALIVMNGANFILN